MQICSAHGGPSQVCWRWKGQKDNLRWMQNRRQGPRLTLGSLPKASGLGNLTTKPGRYEVGTYIILFISGYFLLHTKVRTSILRRNSVNHDNSIHSRFVMCSKVWYNEQFVIDPRDKTTPHDKTIWSCEARLLVMKWTKSTFEHKQIGGKGA